MFVAVSCATFNPNDPLQNLLSSLLGGDPEALLGPRAAQDPEIAAEARAEQAAEEEAARADILATPVVNDEKLQNLINDLYKGTTNPDRVGNGTTMDAIRNELTTGEPTHGRWHYTKGLDSANGLRDWLRENPNASSHDRVVAKSVLDDLWSAFASGEP